jgi:hypothetical protein
LQRAEDLFLVDAVPLYCDLAGGGTTGAGFNAQFAHFVWEYGGSVRIPGLDVIHSQDLHSVFIYRYLPRQLFASYDVVDTGSLQQDALREWFINRYNDLCAHLVRFENFRTKGGNVVPLVQYQAALTVGRILQTTAHLLAARDQATSLNDFWALVDLYAGLMKVGAHEHFFEARFWCRHVVQPSYRLPGQLGELFGSQAGRLYAGWVDQCVGGITHPSRRSGKQVLVGEPPAPIPEHRFFSRFIGVWRNTLHGYQLQDKAQFRDFLAIHDGSLPERITEWGRYTLIGLLEDPKWFLARFQRLPD